MLKLEESQQEMAVHFRLRNSDKAATVYVNPEMVKHLVRKFSEGVSNEELAWKIASSLESQLFMIEKQ